MITKNITAFGRGLTIACDAKCHKAWGINNRPSVQLDQFDDDDIAWLSDNEVGIAPVDPGTYEGGNSKPRFEEERLNKWCYRECERCISCFIGQDPVLPDFSNRLYNKPWKHENE